MRGGGTVWVGIGILVRLFLHNFVSAFLIPFALAPVTCARSLVCIDSDVLL